MLGKLDVDSCLRLSLLPVGRATQTRLKPAAAPARQYVEPAVKAGPAEGPFTQLDRSLHAGFGQLTGGLSPAALGGAYLDWAVTDGVAPAVQLELELLVVQFDRERRLCGAMRHQPDA